MIDLSHEIRTVEDIKEHVVVSAPLKKIRDFVVITRRVTQERSMIIAEVIVVIDEIGEDQSKSFEYDWNAKLC